MTEQRGSIRRDGQPDAPAPDVTRRRLLAGTGALGIAAALGACGQDESTSSAGGGGGGGSGAAGTGGSTGGGSAGGGTGGGPGNGGGSGQALAQVNDIPEGGGKIFKTQNVVVTQPEAGEIKAFSATCTHQGCTVATVSNGTINCTCHGSRFSIVDGSVRNGPATKPLPEQDVSVQGGQISLA